MPIIEVGFFYGGEHLGAKTCRFLFTTDKISFFFNLFHLFPRLIFTGLTALYL